MPDPVKPRRYDNSRRSEAARATRRAVVAAARELFLDIGYPGTTLSAIADRAGVSVQTVYAQFATKRGVLKEVIDQTVAGDDEPVAIGQRESAARVRAEPDPHEKVRLLAQGIAEIIARSAPLHRMLRSAAEVDEEAAQLWKLGSAQRSAGMKEVVGHLVEAGLLRADVPPALAGDRLAVLIDPELYLLTVGDRSWTDEQYEAWLAELMIASLLQDSGSRKRT